MCARRSECEAPTDRNARYATEADCRARTELACVDWSTLPGTAVTPLALTECTESITQAPCSDIRPVFHSESELSASDLPYCLPDGLLDGGAPCATGAQCQTRYCSAATDGCGACTLPIDFRINEAHEGEPCTNPYDCASVLACEAGTCIQPSCATAGCLDSGYLCTGVTETTSHDCPLGTHCVGQNDLGSGTCAPYAAEGAACDRYYGPPCQYPAQCANGTCLLPHELHCP